MTDSEKGLLLVFTGNGKGKTTAALGTVFRALGHGKKVAVVQFIKGSWKYGELVTAEHFSSLLDFHVMGRGFTWKSDNIEKDRAVALDAWKFASDIIYAGEHDLVVLDELTYLVVYNMLEESEMLDVLKRRPEKMHIIVTGRKASDGLIALADLVTEMQEVKHPYKQGIRAQKGLEF